jgi:hypothetical protein
MPARETEDEVPNRDFVAGGILGRKFANDAPPMTESLESEFTDVQWIQYFRR